MVFIPQCDDKGSLEEPLLDVSNKSPSFAARNILVNANTSLPFKAFVNLRCNINNLEFCPPISTLFVHLLAEEWVPEAASCSQCYCALSSARSLPFLNVVSITASFRPEVEGRFRNLLSWP